MSEPHKAPEMIVEISRSKIDVSAEENASITNVKHLASYNWIEDPTPTIAVPGSPALWFPPNPDKPRRRHRVKQDSGLIYKDRNAYRHPDSPLEPLFRSLYIEQPLFDINSIDIVTDRNNIRKLLSFIQPTLTKGRARRFTIKVEMAAQTAIFCRDEITVFEAIPPYEFRGYGHEFEKKYTLNQIRKSTSHHRMVSYRLGGLSFLVRHETDGYVCEPKPVTVDNDSTGVDLEDDSKSKSCSSEEPVSKLTIQKLGHIVSRESTVEIKTRSFKKRLKTVEVAPQLWVSQTLKLICGCHSKQGRFPTPRVQDVTAGLKDWERTHQTDIKKLVVLIKDIVRATREYGGCATILYDVKKDVLIVKKAERRKMLPDDLYSRWIEPDPKNEPASSESQNTQENTSKF